jgi:hypothetical protein
VTVRFAFVSASACACVVGLVLASGLIGCDKTSNDAADAGTSKEPAPAASPSTGMKSPSPPRTAELRPAVPTTTIEGVGTVPAWALDQTTKRCSTSAETRTKLVAVAKGTDAAQAASIAGGTADIATLSKDLGADDCIATRRALANALLAAGRSVLEAKRTDEANRYWRAALTVRPSLVIARYFLARGLSLAGKPEAAAAQLAELARAAQAGDANAMSALESVRVDKDFERVHGQASFDAAVSAAAAPDGGSPSLAGPLKRPETFASAVALLPEEFKKLQDDIGATPNRAIVTFKPAFTNVWLWHPDPSTELYVASVVDDPSKVGQPKADLTLDYGAIAVLRKDAAGKVTLLTVRKTGFAQPTVASGKNGSVIYSFEQMCGGLSGTLSWNGKSIDMNEKSCRDLP